MLLLEGSDHILTAKRVLKSDQLLMLFYAVAILPLTDSVFKATLPSGTKVGILMILHVVIIFLEVL